MPKIIFIYEENKYEVKLYNKNSSITNIFNEYTKKINAKENNLLFLYKGRKISIINSQLTSIMNKFNGNIII